MVPFWAKLCFDATIHAKGIPNSSRDTYFKGSNRILSAKISYIVHNDWKARDSLKAIRPAILDPLPG